MNEPTRQIHLDFHTSEHIPRIGSEFDKKQFQEALLTGRVNLINIFAKCHHSWSYYPTKLGMPHPNLTCDLLGQQIEACHEIGVLAPIYYTVGWSSYDAENHPEWCMRTKDGDYVTGATPWPDDVQATDPKPTFQWKHLCVATEYRDRIRAEVEEICRMYPIDGLWFDIYQSHHLCYCDTCRAGMASEGVDVEDELAVEAYRARQISAHTTELKELIASIHPDASVYFNGLTNIDRRPNTRYGLYDNNSKNDLEDLPTTWGGYDKFPIRSKFFHKEGKPVVAMSGKFHTAWGEFGGFKDPEAIRFEAAAMIAFGACCNFGDQLHPNGLMDMTTYQNIGHAYQYVEKIEEYGIDGLPEATLGVWLAEDMELVEGLCRMLLEEQLDFNIIRPGDSLEAYETIVVPSSPGVLAGHEQELQDFVASGGSVVAVAGGILDRDGTRTILDCGADFLGPSEYDMDFTVAGDRVREEEDSGPHLKVRSGTLPTTPFLNYTSALKFKIQDGAEILGAVHEPYFRRTYGKYCGHQNTPNSTNAADYPSAFRQGNIVVIAHELDRLYYRHGAKVHRVYLASILRMVHRSPMVEVALPSAGRVNLLKQNDSSRYVAHVLYGAPIERGRCSVIEDLPSFRDVDIRLRLPVTVKRMRLIPDEIELEFDRTDDARGLTCYSTTIPAFAAHCGVVAEY